MCLENGGYRITISGSSGEPMNVVVTRFFDDSTNLTLHHDDHISTFFMPRESMAILGRFLSAMSHSVADMIEEFGDPDECI